MHINLMFLYYLDRALIQRFADCGLNQRQASLAFCKFERSDFILFFCAIWHFKQQQILKIIYKILQNNEILNLYNFCY